MIDAVGGARRSDSVAAALDVLRDRGAAPTGATTGDPLLEHVVVGDDEDRHVGHDGRGGEPCDLDLEVGEGVAVEMSRGQDG